MNKNMLYLRFSYNLYFNNTLRLLNWKRDIKKLKEKINKHTM